MVYRSNGILPTLIYSELFKMQIKWTDGATIGTYALRLT
ncbi:hypothetical protein OF001_U30207 [Pseudomonas sp. OF001]|nr:hypothetical protein OF001_U30207 [Pseudomonas sp. OF001]